MKKILNLVLFIIFCFALMPANAMADYALLSRFSVDNEPHGIAYDDNSNTLFLILWNNIVAYPLVPDTLKPGPMKNIFSFSGGGPVPSGIALDPSETLSFGRPLVSPISLYIGKSRDGIYKFNSKGELVGHVMTLPSESSDYSLMDLDIYNSHLYLAVRDEDGRRVKRYSTKGVLEAIFDTTSSRNFRVGLSKNFVFVLDTGSNVVYKFNHLGELIDNWKITSNTLDITVDDKGMVFVLSENNFDKYDSNGNSLGKWILPSPCSVIDVSNDGTLVFIGSEIDRKIYIFTSKRISHPDK